MTKYIFVPVAEYKIAMLNRSVHKALTDVHIVSINDVDHYVFEVDEKQLRVSTAFDNYEWHCNARAKEKINA